MFSHRFFMHEVGFDAAIEQTRTPRESTPRFVLLARFAHDMLGWFEAQSALESIKLACVALAEVEKEPMGVRIRHHFTLTAINGTVPSADEYAIQYLPYAQMGAGVFQLSRKDAEVQKALALSTGATLEYEALVYALALRIHAAFELIYVTHDVGLRSASS